MKEIKDIKIEYSNGDIESIANLNGGAYEEALKAFNRIYKAYHDVKNHKQEKNETIKSNSFK
jgi:hypothetical protein